MTSIYRVNIHFLVLFKFVKKELCWRNEEGSFHRVIRLIWKRYQVNPVQLNSSWGSFRPRWKRRATAMTLLANLTTVSSKIQFWKKNFVEDTENFLFITKFFGLFKFLQVIPTHSNLLADGFHAQNKSERLWPRHSSNEKPTLLKSAFLKKELCWRYQQLQFHRFTHLNVKCYQVIPTDSNLLAVNFHVWNKKAGDRHPIINQIDNYALQNDI